MKNNITYSVVVPVLNEAQNVGSLYDEIKRVMTALNKPFEIIFVDDGSRDSTVEELSKKSPITIIRFRKNTGQASALDAGIKHASGNVLITVDGDGQDDPNNIPMLLKKLSGGYDVVCAWRDKRNDSFFKRFLSWGWRHLRNNFINDEVHDAGTQFRVYNSEVFENIDLYGEMHRFIPALVRWQGFRITEVKVNHRPRKHGKSKYSWKRPLKGFADLLYMWFWRKYSTRPQQIFGVLGVSSFLCGITILVFIACLRLFRDYYLSDKIWPLVGFFFIMIGIQFFTTGILAANMNQINPTKKYFIKEIIEK